jgi:hypothetical protein
VPAAAAAEQMEEQQAAEQEPAQRGPQAHQETPHGQQRWVWGLTVRHLLCTCHSQWLLLFSVYLVYLGCELDSFVVVFSSFIEFNLQIVSCANYPRISFLKKKKDTRFIATRNVIVYFAEWHG